MNTNKKILMTALAAALGFSAMGAQAAMLNSGDQLTIEGSGTSSGAWVSGSYFAMDMNGNSKIAATEKFSLTMGATGLVIGTTTAQGASHPGAVTSGDTNAIDRPWTFFSNTGSDYVTVPVTGGTTAGLNLSGWTVTWNGIAAIPMGTGAWATGTGAGHTGATGTFANGIANFYWNGVYGATYSLDYRATVPIGDASGFGGVKYELHLEGIAGLLPPEVPVPAAVWLFGSGLFGLLGMARRKLAT